MTRSWPACLVSLTLALIPSPATSRADEPRPADPPGAAVALVRDALPGVDLKAVDALGEALKGAGVPVSVLNGEQVADPAVLTPERYFLLLVPQARVYPAAAAGALSAYLRAGGHLLVTGGPAFDRPAWKRDGRWFDREAVRAALAEAKFDRRVFDFESGPVAWPRSTDGAGVGGGTRVEPGGAASSGHALRIWTDRLPGWSNHTAPLVGDRLFTPGHTLLGFWAKGDRETPQMLAEVRESDGSRWMAVVPLTTDWSRVVLTPDDFQFWPDSSTHGRRGGSGDRLRPEAASGLILGLARSHTPGLSDGPHAFWVDEIGTAPDPFAGLTSSPAPAFPVLETVSPSYKTFALARAAEVVATPGQAVVDAGFRAPAPAGRSAVARPAGRGFGQGRPWRWVPLLEARDGNGQRRGTPAWLLLNESGPLRGSVVASFAVDDLRTLATPPWRDALVSAVQQIRRGVFLSEGGTTLFSRKRGEPLDLGATAVNWGRAPVRARIRVAVSARGGAQVFESSDVVTLHPGEARTLRGRLRPEAAPAEGIATSEVLVGGRVVDRIHHTFGTLPEAPAARDAFVTVKDGNFVAGGKAWYPVGVNYWPLYVAGLEPDTYGPSWLAPSAYDPEEVERDLALMNELGIDMVSVQLGDLRELPNLLDFLRRCGNHGVRVNGFLGGASPVDFHEEQVARYVRAGELDRNPTLFAYDIIWEPGNWMFSAEHRKRWDREWERWIAERYGSLAAAEADWGVPAHRDGGRVVSPNDREFHGDGPWRVMVAAYRRFMDDLMSRKWNDAVTKLRAIDPNHLVSFRQGNTLPHDFALTATVKHIDFICPEGYSIPPGKPGYDAAGFLTRYVAHTTGGKPIDWAEFGRSVWDASLARPDPKALPGQGEYHELFYRVVVEAGANATTPWWWPGGYRVDEKSDFGMIDPDGTPRPAAEVIRSYATRLKAPRTPPRPTRWFTFDRDAHAGGYWWAAFHEGARAYAEARKAGDVLGVRSPGTGSDSATRPVVAVGNRPFNGKNPPKYLDAEFNRLEVLGRDGRWHDALRGEPIAVDPTAPLKLRASVGNLQEATWLAPAGRSGKIGGVFLTTAPGSALTVKRELPRDTPYLADAEFGEFAASAPPRGSSRLVLRMCVDDDVPFGEVREVRLNAE